MSRKFIGQVNNQNFIYPNNFLAEYDTEIIHDVNENSVSGTVTNFSATTVSSTGITFSYNYTWSKNNAEPFINDANNLMLLSVHCMAQDQEYYKPWRLVDYVSTVSTGSTTSSGTDTFQITPSQMGLSTFENGTYYFEFRFIGHRAIYPVCQTYAVGTIPTPTPTPTPTPPTPTPTLPPTPTPTVPPYTSGATINVTDTGYIKYESFSGQTYLYVGSLGTVTLTDCLICSSIAPGIPFADLANFTIIQCGTSCTNPPPTPTPTPGGSKNLQIYVRDVDGTPATLTLFYSVNGGGNINVPGASGTQLPGTCTFIYTITGLNLNDSVEFGTSISCVMTGAQGFGCPSSISTNTTYTYVMDTPSTQAVGITVDSGFIP